MTTPVWIGLGSNLGDREATLDAALAALAGAPGVAVEAVSSRHETSPVGGPSGQGPFLNAAARLRTNLGPRELLAVAQEIEDRLGRVREVRWGERTIDIDLLIFGTRFLDEPDLKLPHPRIGFRRFVLAPLAEIAPRVVDTLTRRTIADLLANLDRRPRLLALDGPPGPVKSAVFRRLVEELPGSGVEQVGEDPEPGPSPSPLERFRRGSEAFARQARALEPSRWNAEVQRDRWVVSDFYLDPGLIRSEAHPPPVTFLDGPGEDWAGQAAADDEWRRHNLRAEANMLPPTCVVIVPGTSGEFRRPGIRSVPSLWPESVEADAIVAEILATCRGMEAT